MSDNSESNAGVKGLDIVGIALILFAILWSVFFPAPRYSDIGSYSILQLLPIVVGIVGVLCVIVARIRRR
jgi:hypothetical protein